MWGRRKIKKKERKGKGFHFLWPIMTLWSKINDWSERKMKLISSLHFFYSSLISRTNKYLSFSICVKWSEKLKRRKRSVSLNECHWLGAWLAIAAPKSMSIHSEMYKFLINERSSLPCLAHEVVDHSSVAWWARTSASVRTRSFTVPFSLFSSCAHSYEVRRVSAQRMKRTRNCVCATACCLTTWSRPSHTPLLLFLWTTGPIIHKLLLRRNKGPVSPKCKRRRPENNFFLYLFFLAE